MFKLAIVTALWKRPSITNDVLTHLDWLRRELVSEGVELTVYAAASRRGEPRASHALVKSGALERIDIENKPLSRKWQAAGRAAFESRPDAVMIVGSDDLISLGYIRAAVDLVQSGFDYINAMGLFYMDTEETSATYGVMLKTRAHRIGAGRTISARLLDKIDGQIWYPESKPVHIDKLLDTQMENHLRRTAGDLREAFIRLGKTPYGFASILDLKSSVNIWGFESLAKRLGGHPMSNRFIRTMFEGCFPEVLHLASACETRSESPITPRDVMRLLNDRTKERTELMRARCSYTNKANEGAVKPGDIFYATPDRRKKIEQSRNPVAEFVGGNEAELIEAAQADVDARTERLAKAQDAKAEEAAKKAEKEAAEAEAKAKAEKEAAEAEAKAKADAEAAESGQSSEGDSSTKEEGSARETKEEKPDKRRTKAQDSEATSS